jgi:hypothetical protein
MATVTFAVLLGTNQTFVAAQEEETVAAESTTASSAATTEKLKERIEKIVEEKREQIKGVLSAIDQQKRGTIGQVTRISEENVTIKTRVTTEIIPLDENITIEKDGDDIEISEIAVDDWLLILGLIEDDTFAPKRILVSSDSLRPPTTLVALGSIDTIERSELTISPRNEETNFTISTSSSTKYQDLNGNKIDRADIDEATQALVVGYEDEDGDKSAALIRILTVVEIDEE